MRVPDVLRVFALAALLAGCGDDGATPDAGPPPDAGGVDAGPPADSGGVDAGPAGRDAGVPVEATAEEARAWVEAYRDAHPGREGDINALSEAQVAADPEAARLLSLCGADQRPVIPLLAWEYGGADHPWIAPEASALVYCVYTPVAEPTEHWSHDAVEDHVTADVYILFPDDNPCRDEEGAAKVTACLGDATNIEILVDTASYGDGLGVGLSLSEASTELMLLLEDGTRVHLAFDA